MSVKDVVPHVGATLVDNVSHLKLPWEQGIYKSLFEDDPFAGSLTIPVCPSAPVAAKDSESSKAKRACAVTPGKAFAAFKQLDDVSYDERMARRADVSLGRLVAFVQALPPECKPEHWPSDYAACVEYLQASVGVRSALTKEKRANSLVQYLRWASLEGMSANLFAEEAFWAYIQHLKRSLAPVSRGPAVASLSRRCLGALEQLEAAKGPIKQASPLTVSELAHLHRPAWDRASAAYLLVCAYGRARAGDFSRVDLVEVDLETDSGFLEVVLKTHKGAKKARLKNQLVPVLIPSVGVDGLPWVSDAVAAFSGVSLSLAGVVDGALFRPPKGSEGTPGKREVRSEEVTSHSLKATCLSWCSKFGVDNEVQNMLGRHSDAVRGSAPLYSRDLCAAPVRKLQHIILQIHRGLFAPDATRSRYFPRPTDVVEVKDELPTHEPRSASPIAPYSPSPQAPSLAPLPQTAEASLSGDLGEPSCACRFLSIINQHIKLGNGI